MLDTLTAVPGDGDLAGGFHRLDKFSRNFEFPKVPGTHGPHMVMDDNATPHRARAVAEHLQAQLNYSCFKVLSC